MKKVLKKDIAAIAAEPKDYSLLKDANFLLITGLIIFDLILYLVRPGGESWETFSSYLGVFTAILSIYYAVNVLTFFTLKSLIGRTVLFFSLGIIFWGLGDLIAFIFKPEGVSVPEMLYLAAYPLFSIGVFLAIRTISEDFLKDKKKLAIILLILAICLFLFFSVSKIGWDNNVSLAENIVNIGFIIGDAVVLCGVIIIFITMFTSNFSLPWTMIIISFAASFVADTAYSLIYDKSGILSSIWQVLFLWVYLFLILGLYLLKRNVVVAIKKA